MNQTTPTGTEAGDLDLDKLEALAKAADQGEGQHIYIHWRDANNWEANLAWHNAASPAAFLALIALARRAAPATSPHAVPDSAQAAEEVRNQALEEAARSVLSRCIGFAADDSDLYEMVAAIRALKSTEGDKS